MIIAINQPYFSAYAGYYALIRAADLFVFYDCVQFPRRGRVHRSQIHNSEAGFTDGWLTLQTQKYPPNTRIEDIMMQKWPEDFPQNAMHKILISLLSEELDLAPYQLSDTMLSDFLYAHHEAVFKRLGITTPMLRSSDLKISDDIRSQDRLIKICEEVGANSYINLPGGEELYDPESFFSHEIDLNFIDTSGIARYGYLQALALGDEQFSIFLEESRITRFKL